MGHEPRSLVRHAKHAFQLLRAHALLARAHQVIREDPLVKGNLGALEHGADRDRELHLAVGAVQQAGTVRGAVQAGIALRAAAVRADGAMGPVDRLKVLARRVFVVESCFATWTGRQR